MIEFAEVSSDTLMREIFASSIEIIAKSMQSTTVFLRHYFDSDETLFGN